MSEPEATKADDQLVADYLAERAAPWRLVGRYEQALRMIRDALESGASMSGKLAMTQRNIDAADVPRD